MGLSPAALIVDGYGNEVEVILDGSAYRLRVESKDVKSDSTSISSVSASTSSVTLLAANTNRLGASIFNDSNKALYLKLGAVASTTSYTVKISADGLYETPFGYTGIIDGIWANGASGSAKITENT